MSKYIEVEKLNEVVDRVYNQYVYDYGLSAAGSNMRWIYDAIESLQQEQESVAERFARIVRGNLNGIDKKVQHKFEQLYFEITGDKMYGGFND